MSFFTSGSVDTNSFSRDKLPCLETGDPENAQQAVYRVRLTDFADYYGAVRGDRTQINFEVVEGIVAGGTRGSHVVMHQHKEAWQTAKARGEIAAALGAFMGLSRDASGLRITGEVFGAETRVVKQNPETGKTIETSRSADELRLVNESAEAYLVVAPYFDKKSKKRKSNPKTKQPSVTYELFPLTARLQVTAGTAMSPVSGEYLVDGSDGEDAPEAPVETDALERALADGWKRNGATPWFYKKGEPKQLKEEALRAMYA